MFINIYRNPKTRNWFRYETFIHHFEFKGFSTRKRERHTHTHTHTQSFYADCFYIVSSQPNQRAAPVAHNSSGLAQLWISTLSFGGRNSTHCFFSNLSPRFRCVTSPTSPCPISYLGFLFWHLWMTHPLRAHMNTCVNVAPN